MMQPPDRLSNAVIRLAFEHFENVFMRQSWWERLNSSVQGVIERRVRSGGPISDRGKACLVEDDIDYFSAHASATGIIV